jgi:hypothetical protein
MSWPISGLGAVEESSCLCRELNTGRPACSPSLCRLRMINGHGAVGGMRIGKGNRCIWRTLAPFAMLSVINPTRTNLGSNPGRRASYGTPITKYLYEGFYVLTEVTKKRSIFYNMTGKGSPTIRRNVLLPSSGTTNKPSKKPERSEEKAERRWRQCVSSNRRLSSTGLHGFTSQKIVTLHCVLCISNIRMTISCLLLHLFLPNNQLKYVSKLSSMDEFPYRLVPSN